MVSSKVRRFVPLSLAAVLVMALLLAGCGQPSGGGSESGSDNKLVVANWQAYATDQDYGAKAFEEMYDCTVEHYYINSLPELLNVLSTGGMGEIDVVNINPLYIDEYRDAGVLAPIDVSELSAYEDLMPNFRDLPALVEGGEIYGVPWVWGSTAMFYNADLVTDAPEHWDALWDPKYAGKVGYFNEYYTAIQTAALYLGEDPYAPDLNKIKEALLALKANTRTFWEVNDDFIKAYNSGDITIGNSWSGCATTLYANGENIRYLYPEEGSVGWCDYWVLVKDTKEIDLAMKWIDFCTSEDFQKAMGSSGEAANAPANLKAIDSLSDDDKKNLQIYPEAPTNLVLALPQDEADREAWTNLWLEVLASN
jgi:spermidine/putrescine transport system substrate-binding protein